MAQSARVGACETRKVRRVSCWVSWVRNAVAEGNVGGVGGRERRREAIWTKVVSSVPSPAWRRAHLDRLVLRVAVDSFGGKGVGKALLDLLGSDDLLSAGSTQKVSSVILSLTWKLHAPVNSEKRVVRFLLAVRSRLWERRDEGDVERRGREGLEEVGESERAVRSCGR